MLVWALRGKATGRHEQRTFYLIDAGEIDVIEFLPMHERERDVLLAVFFVGRGSTGGSFVTYTTFLQGAISRVINSSSCEYKMNMHENTGI